MEAHGRRSCWSERISPEEGDVSKQSNTIHSDLKNRLSFAETHPIFEGEVVLPIRHHRPPLSKK